MNDNHVEALIIKYSLGMCFVGVMVIFGAKMTILIVGYMKAKALSGFIEGQFSDSGPSIWNWIHRGK